MKVLLVGGGGREHALAWRLKQDYPRCTIIAAPGNPGIAELATCVPVSATDIEGLLALSYEHGIDWTLVGPEAPLAAGLADAFRAHNAAIFGPSAAGAALETSKAFSKTLMVEAGVPTARAITVNDVQAANRAIDELGAPVVVKASGLAAGKGVIVCMTVEEAKAAATSMLVEDAFGDAGDTVLIEEFMEGEELSVFVLTDGTRMIALPAAQDHKRLLEGDRGPNTGGMGAYCPVSIVDRSPDLIHDVLERVAGPTLERMRDRGTPFTGLLYVGLMLTSDGPRVVEFNCRFGDPETQAVLPALSGDVTSLMHIIASGGRLPDVKLTTSRAAVTTVLAAMGYPEKPRSGDVISLPSVPSDVLVFHAGTKRNADGALVTAGGRVLTVTGLGDSLEDAQRRSQQFANAVSFEGKQFRSDIGWRELGLPRGARATKGAGAT